MAASLCWGCVSVSLLIFKLPSDVAGWCDQACYFSAVLMLCPFIAILGARRPVANVWSLFVVSPLILVLSWPLFVTWMHGSAAEPLQIQPAMLLGFAVVMLMAFGNYFGTLFTIPMLLLAAAVVLLVVPLTSSAPQFLPAKMAARWWADGCLSIAVILAAWCWKYRSPRFRHPPLDRLWLDFGNLFGMVWASRLLVRMNDVATTKQWPVRLELHGLVWEDNVPAAETARISAEIEQNFRWMLKRFVNNEWIDAYLLVDTSENIDEKTSSSGGLS